MICSSVNLPRFIVQSLQQGRTLILRGGKTQWQVTVFIDLVSSLGERSRSTHLHTVRMNIVRRSHERGALSRCFSAVGAVANTGS
jgi:hypothetical protein